MKWVEYVDSEVKKLKDFTKKKPSSIRQKIWDSETKLNASEATCLSQLAFIELPQKSAWIKPSLQ